MNLHEATSERALFNIRINMTNSFSRFRFFFFILGNKTVDLPYFPNDHSGLVEQLECSCITALTSRSECPKLF
jgi:hypothetical protein